MIGKTIKYKLERYDGCTYTGVVQDIVLIEKRTTDSEYVGQGSYSNTHYLNTVSAYLCATNNPNKKIDLVFPSQIIEIEKSDN